ncbi:MAG: PEP-CTERM sorting domain-containing protein [Planctomycetota bacterium]
MIASRYVSVMTIVRLLRASLLVYLLATSFSVGSTWATTAIVDAGGFEGFSLGNLVGQAGWAGAGGGGGSATLQNTTVESGSRAVRVDRAALSDDRWAMPVGGQGFPNNRYILVEWDMNVTATGAPNGTFGPFLGVDTYKAPSGFSVLGALGVDATTGDVLYQQQNSGFIAETGMTVDFGEWNSFAMLLDFEDDEYTMFLNDSFVLTTGFVDGAASTFTDADIAAFAAGGDPNSQNQTGTAYFDNFRVLDISLADFDIDGDVDGDDFETWDFAYAVSADGDTNSDGDTDGDDFLLLQRDSDAAAPLAGLVTSVPEPSTMSALCLSLAVLASLRRCPS